MDTAQMLILGAPAILFAVTLHEVSHGLVAKWLGDPTAKMLGRLTANPLKHIDPIGTVLVPIITVLTIGLPFGWAKPVPVDVRNFASPQKDMALVALAGPVSNFLMAVFWALVLLLLKIGLPHSEIGYYLGVMALVGININLILMVLNLLPIPPLDGGRVVTGVLPPSLAYYYGRLEYIGLWVVIFLLITGILGKILGPLVQGVQLQLFRLFGL